MTAKYQGPFIANVKPKTGKLLLWYSSCSHVVEGYTFTILRVTYFRMFPFMVLKLKKCEVLALSDF